MPRKNYSKEDHQQAWDLFFEHRTYQKVADVMGLDYGTVTRWASSDYKCPHPGCQYHDWDRLLEEKDLAVTARLKLYEEGNLNPIDHDQAIRAAVESHVPAPQPGLSDEENRKRQLEIDRRRRILETLVRSDFERLAQWELIWSKIIFQLTGQVLDFKVLVDSDGNPLNDEEVRKVLGRGLKASTLEGAVRSLKEVQEQVDKLKDRIGLHKKMGNEDIGPQSQSEDAPELTIEDLRHFQELLTNTHPEKRAVLVKMFKADQRMLQALSDGQGSTGVSKTAGAEDSVPLSPVR